VLFVFQEDRAPEPIIPLHLFRNTIFNAASGAGFIVGLAMFGSIVYLPLFLQVVHAISPTSSGLRLLPVMASMLISSVVSGRTISRIGRYKFFPIAGMVVVTAGMILFSRLNPSTSALRLSLYMVVLGLGLGMVMQVLVLAVQNAVEYRDLGTATSSAIFFRSMGSVFGLAIFGAIFATKLAYWMPRLIPKQSLGSLAGKDPLHMTPAELRSLPPSVHQGLTEAFSHSIHSVFLWAIPFAVAGFLITLLLREIPLREREQPAANTAPAPES
jgi:predicted MFS family arabinose efflux permease